MPKCVKKIFKYVDRVGFSSLVIKLSGIDTVWFSVPDFAKNADIDCFEDCFNDLTSRTNRSYSFIDEGGEKFTNLSCLREMISNANLDKEEQDYLIYWMEKIELDIKKYEQLKTEITDLKKDKRWLEMQRRNILEENIKLRDILFKNNIKI